MHVVVRGWCYVQPLRSPASVSAPSEQWGSLVTRAYVVSLFWVKVNTATVSIEHDETCCRYGVLTRVTRTFLVDNESDSASTVLP